MSSPTTAILYKDGNEILRMFVNIGRVFDEKYLFRCIEDGIRNTVSHYKLTKTIDYDNVFMYNQLYTKDELRALSIKDREN